MVVLVLIFRGTYIFFIVAASVYIPTDNNFKLKCVQKNSINKVSCTIFKKSLLLSRYGEIDRTGDTATEERVCLSSHEEARASPRHHSGKHRVVGGGKAKMWALPGERVRKAGMFRITSWNNFGRLRACDMSQVVWYLHLG